jgi:hypothetical protein
MMIEGKEANCSNVGLRSGGLFLFLFFLVLNAQNAAAQLHHHEVQYERKFPISLSVVFHYHTLKHWSFILGPGSNFKSMKINF